jgi:hypothetical protein
MSNHLMPTQMLRGLIEVDATRFFAGFAPGRFVYDDDYRAATTRVVTGIAA